MYRKLIAILFFVGLAATSLFAQGEIDVPTKPAKKPTQAKPTKPRQPQAKPTKPKQPQNKPAKTTQPEPVSSSVRNEGDNLVFTVGGVEFTMVRIPGGTITLDGGSNKDKHTAYSVTLSDYYMGETEVTQALWKAVMGSEPTKCLSSEKAWDDEYGRGDNYPAYEVTYDDVIEFIRKLNQITGRTFNLPTEPEWEYAAREGRNGGYKYSGSDNIDEVAWYRRNSDHNSHPVKGKRPNAFGLYDMTGNVSEWCNVWYDEYSSSSQTNPLDPSTSTVRAIRGGSYFDSTYECGVSDREESTGYAIGNSIGFRLALH